MEHPILCLLAFSVLFAASGCLGSDSHVRAQHSPASEIGNEESIRAGMGPPVRFLHDSLSVALWQVQLGAVDVPLPLGTNCLLLDARSSPVVEINATAAWTPADSTMQELQFFFTAYGTGEHNDTSGSGNLRIVKNFTRPESTQIDIGVLVPTPRWPAVAHGQPVTIDYRIGYLGEVGPSATPSRCLSAVS